MKLCYHCKLRQRAADGISNVGKGSPALLHALWTILGMLVLLFGIQKGWRWTGEGPKQNHGMLQGLVRDWTCSAWGKGSGDLICAPVFNACLQRSQTLPVCKEPSTKDGEMGTSGTEGDPSWTQQDNFVTVITLKQQLPRAMVVNLTLESSRFGCTKCGILCCGTCFYRNRLDQLTSEVPSNLSFDFSNQYD